MKRFLAIMLAALLLLTLPACGKKADPPAFTEPQQITIEYLKERTIPYSLLGLVGSFEAEFRNNDELNAGLYGSTSTMRFLFDGKDILVNENVDYDTGDFSHIYYSSDINDPYIYIEDNENAYTTDRIDRSLQERLNSSILYLDIYNCSITDYGTTDGNYEIGFDTRDSNNEDALTIHTPATIQPKTGLILSALIETYDHNTLSGVTHLTMRYSTGIAIDQSIKEHALAAEEANANTAVEEQPPVEETPSTPDELTFAAEDLDGKLYTYNDFADGKLLMVNFWEPWCAPCVQEMPDIEALYKKYQDQGFDVLGVFTTTDNAATVLSDAGITYPNVLRDDRLAAFATDVVPGTIFVGQGGKVLTSEPYIGQKSYDEWDAIISELLESQS